MKQVISRKNWELVISAIQNISDKGIGTDKSLWVIYGSYVINAQKQGSDLDLLCVDDIFDRSQRVVENYDGVPIHLTCMPISELAKDGRDRRYGGYFTGKIINPHILYGGSDQLKRLANRAAGEFIGELAGYIAGLTKKSEGFSAEEITAQVYVAYMSTDPWFDSYFLSYFCAPDFGRVWKHMVKDVMEILLTSNLIYKARSGGYRYKTYFDNYKYFHKERMSVAARHWSFGVTCHGNNLNFYNEIVDKAKFRIKKLDPTGKIYIRMVSFLESNSGLKTIYV